MSASASAVRMDSSGFRPWSVGSGSEAVDILPMLLEAVRNDGDSTGQPSDVRFDLANAFMQLQPQPSTESALAGSSLGAFANPCGNEIDYDDDEFARRASKVFEEDDHHQMTPSASFEVTSCSAPPSVPVVVGGSSRFLEEKSIAQHCSRITASLNQTPHRRMVQFSVGAAEEPPVQLFIGQLPFNFNQIGLAQVLNALLARAGAHPIVSVMKGRPTCAFITLDAKGAALLLEYNKRLLSDVDGVWCADLGQTEALEEILLLSELRQRRQLAGSPDKPLVIEPVRGSNPNSHDGSSAMHYGGEGGRGSERFQQYSDLSRHSGSGSGSGFHVMASEPSDPHGYPNSTSAVGPARLMQLGFVFHQLTARATVARSYAPTQTLTMLSPRESVQATLFIAHLPLNPNPIFVAEMLQTLAGSTGPSLNVASRLRQGGQPTSIFVEVPQSCADTIQSYSGRVWVDPSGIWVGPVGHDAARTGPATRPISIELANPQLGDVFARDDLSEGLRTVEFEELNAAGCKYIPANLGAYPEQAPTLSRHQGKVRQVFLGMLPSAFNVRALCEAIHNVLGVTDEVITRCQIGSKPTCAFVTLVQEHAEVLLTYAKRILCDREGMWVAPLGNSRAEAALGVASERRPQAPARGIPSHLMVIEPVLGANRLGSSEGHSSQPRKQAGVADQAPAMPYAMHPNPFVTPMWYPALPFSMTVGGSPTVSSVGAPAQSSAPVVGVGKAALPQPRGRLDTATGVWIPADAGNAAIAVRTGADAVKPAPQLTTGAVGTCCSGCGLPHVPALVKLGEVCSLCRAKLPPSSFAKRCKTPNCSASEIICTRCLALAHE